MQMSQSNSYLSDQETSLLFREPLYFVKMAEELPAFNEFHEEVDAELVLENIIHVDYKWMINCVQNVFL